MTSRAKKIIFIFLGFIVFLVLISIIFSKRNQPANLIMWGFYDSSDVVSSIIDRFQRDNPRISIQYIQKDPQNYYHDLILAFANNKAPDIFILPGNWIPVFKNKIVPLDLTKDKEINQKFIENNYPQIVQNDLVFNNNLYGIPISIDTLALYYNKDIFYQEKIPLPPQNWQELLNLVPRLKKVDNKGNLQRAAVALGTYDNINWSSDILASLMMQYGSPMVDIYKKQAVFGNLTNFNGQQIIPGVEALKEYTQFANKKSQYFTWSRESYNNIYAFSERKTAMIISYNLIQKSLKENNNLHYGIAPFPLLDVNNKQYYGRTMNLVVSNRSRSPKEAWLFLKYWSKPEVNEMYYLKTKNIPARLDVIKKLTDDPEVGVFALQALSSNSWYQFNFNRISSIFSKMINDVLLGNVSYEDVVKTAVDVFNVEWQKQ